MTRASLREYAAVQRERYLQATRAEKRQLLDKVVAVAGIHRKAAIRLLRRAPRAPTAPLRAGRPRQYRPAVAAAAEVLWQASGRIGSIPSWRIGRHIALSVVRAVGSGPSRGLDDLV